MTSWWVIVFFEFNLLLHSLVYIPIIVGCQYQGTNTMPYPPSGFTSLTSLACGVQRWRFRHWSQLGECILQCALTFVWNPWRLKTKFRNYSNLTIFFFQIAQLFWHQDRVVLFTRFFWSHSIMTNKLDNISQFNVLINILSILVIYVIKYRRAPLVARVIGAGKTSCYMWIRCNQEASYMF